MRSFERCAPALRALVIDPLEASVFISTWNTIGLTGSPIDGNTGTIQTNSQLNKINALYNPTKIETEQLRIGHGAKYRRFVVDGRDPNGVLNNAYKVLRANQLRKMHERAAGIEYDVVIRTRPDLHLLDILPFDLINEAATNRTLYIPSFGNFDGLNDQLAFGCGKVMDIYAGWHDAFDSIVSRVVFHPEALLKRYILDKEVKVKFFDTDYVLERVVGNPFSPKQHSNGIPEELKESE